MRIASRPLRRFTRSERGVIAIEAVLILPLLIWAVLAAIVFVDAYRAQTQNQRATYVIADAVSRLWDPMTNEYFVGLWDLHGMMVNYSNQTHIRVSVVQWSEADQTNILRWSQTSTSDRFPWLTQEQVDAGIDRVPMLSDGDSLVLVETWMDYEPPFSVGLNSTVYRNEIFVSPRYVPQITYRAPDDDSVS